MFPSLSPSTVLHLTRAEYHTNSYSHKKRRRCRAEARYITTVFIPAVYYTKNDLVASKRNVKKERTCQ